MRLNLFLGLFLGAALAVAGCGSSDAPPPPLDASVDLRLDAPATCAAICDDGDYCNGVELCAPGRAEADARGCVDGASPCESHESCDEEMDACRACSDGDADGDGVTECDGDCDDDDATRYPGASEACDDAGRDEDCNDVTFGSRDGDADGFTDSRCCNGIICGNDCDDARGGAHPGLPEVCGDSVDNDCNGEVDEGGTLYRDLDNDGRGDSATSMAGMCQPGWVSNDDDCDDLRLESYEGAREMCDGLDNDCNSVSDPGGPEPSEDRDGDRHSAVSASCLGRGEVGALGSAFIKDDCDDASPTRYTGAAEICGNGIDEDCDGTPDNPSQRVCTDGDGDAHGARATIRTVASCTLPAGTTTEALCDDCNDLQPAAYPGAREICDRIDNDCSAGGGAAIDEDADGDGYAPAAALCAGRGEASVPAAALPKGDCDDTRLAANPGRAGAVQCRDDLDCDGDHFEGAGICEADQTIDYCGTPCVRRCDATCALASTCTVPERPLQVWNATDGAMGHLCGGACYGTLWCVYSIESVPCQAQYGPYTNLPPGTYRVSWRFNAGGSPNGTTLQFDVFNGSTPIEDTGASFLSGELTVDLDFTLTACTVVEFRVSVRTISAANFALYSTTLRQISTTVVL